MSTEQNPINKIFLLLQSNGYLVLDKDHLWDGCDTPELDPSIEMTPVPIRKLVELLRSRNLECCEAEDANRLKILLKEFEACSTILSDTITEIETQF